MKFINMGECVRIYLLIFFTFPLVYNAIIYVSLFIQGNKKYCKHSVHFITESWTYRQVTQKAWISSKYWQLENVLYLLFHLSNWNDISNFLHIADIAVIKKKVFLKIWFCSHGRHFLDFSPVTSFKNKDNPFPFSPKIAWGLNEAVMTEM